MGQFLNKTITSSDDNLETFSLLWLDASVNSEENARAQDELHATINQLKAFSEINECERYIKSVPKDDRIVLIVSGHLGRRIVPSIHSLDQLLSIYVYCHDQHFNEQWSSKFSKVKAVVIDLKELICRIQFDQDKRQKCRIYESLPISIFDPKIVHEKLTADLQGNLVHSQLLINCLLQMRPNANDKNELISISTQIYKKNRTELNIIKDFENHYSSDQAISWYIKDSFLSRILNKALRTQNIDVLFLFQFFIADIRRQLEKNRCTSPIKAYRSQLMSKDEINKLKNSIGQFISINSFFSTTMDSKNAIRHFENTDGLEQVLFEIDADPPLNKDKPFADIRSFSNNNEEETLFMLGSIFQILKIPRQQNGIWRIQLKLCSDNSEQFNSIDDKNQFLSFGHVLTTMGKIEEAEIYYRRLVDELPKDHPDQARCYQALGAVVDEKGNYDVGLEMYEKSLKINLKTVPVQPLDIASNYNGIGEINRKKGDYEKAHEYFKKALETLGKDPGGKDLAKKAVCLNNIGIVYQEQQQYKEALDFYRQAYNIRTKYFPSDQTSLGMSNNNMGNAYYFLNLYDEALYFYQEALKIYKKTLPPQHPKFASTYNNLGAIHEDHKDFKAALEYYMEAAKIYNIIYTPTHANVIKVEENVQRILSKVKK